MRIGFCACASPATRMVAAAAVSAARRDQFMASSLGGRTSGRWFFELQKTFLLSGKPYARTASAVNRARCASREVRQKGGDETASGVPRVERHHRARIELALAAGV